MHLGHDGGDWVGWKYAGGQVRGVGDGICLVRIVLCVLCATYF
jgi:hypothetical protein